MYAAVSRAHAIHIQCFPGACGEARIINSEVFALEDLILQFKKGGELHVLAQKGLTYSLML